MRRPEPCQLYNQRKPGASEQTIAGEHPDNADDQPGTGGRDGISQSKTISLP